MSCTIVVGGQYGSEGKGKTVALLTQTLERPWVIRCGGPNSGHTIFHGGQEIVLKQVPAGVANPGATLLLAAGCAVSESILLHELELLAIDRERIVVDPRAILVTLEDQKSEGVAMNSIGSTGSGTGAALIRRMSRGNDVTLVESSERLRSRVRIEPVAPLLHCHLDRNGEVIIEGTQGFGLSLLHGFHYPFVTARDTTASGFAAEVGLSPRQVDHIVMVVRTFPIRVGGPSGPLPDEIDWDEIQRISGAPEPLPEFTSVTHRLRRVARFDMEAVVTACMYNRPTGLSVMGVDRLDHANYDVNGLADLTHGARRFIRNLENKTGVPVEWIGTGPRATQAIQVTSPLDQRDLWTEARSIS